MIGPLLWLITKIDWWHSSGHRTGCVIWPSTFSCQQTAEYGGQRQLKSYLFHIWCARHCCGIFRNSGTECKLANSLTYLLMYLCGYCCGRYQSTRRTMYQAAVTVRTSSPSSLSTTPTHDSANTGQRIRWKITVLCCIEGSHASLKVPESTWIFSPLFQGLESTWKQDRCLKVLEFYSTGPWKSLNSPSQTAQYQ